MKPPIKMPGLVRAQQGAPGTAENVTYDVDVYLPDGGVMRRTGVKPSGIRPIAALDVAPLEKFDRLIEVWDFDGKWHYQIKEYVHSEDCEDAALALIRTVTQMTTAERATLGALLGATPA